LIANCEALQLVCRAQSAFIKTQLAATKHAGLPILAASAPFKAGGRAGPEHYTDIPVGGLQLRNVADLYSFPNTIRAVRVTGAQITDWLERSAVLFNQITPGVADQALLNPDFPSYNFDIITGITYEIDPSQPPRFNTDGKLIDATAQRIKDPRFQGKPLDPAQVFIVATNNYRVSTCGVLSKLDLNEIAYEAPVTIREILLQYIATHRPIEPFTEPNWRLADLPETTLLFDSSPRTREHLPNVPGLSIEPVGECENGFLQYRLQPR
jgi:2',3'-cyclic-nucleotide 2'-phosphodiesterase/3'-nucleotidase